MIRTLLTFVVAGFVLSAARADEIRILNGKSLTGTLEKITDKEITFKTPAGPVTTSMTQVLELTLRPGNTMPSGSFTEALLVDDSLLRCTKVTVGAKETKLDLPTGPSIKVPNSVLVTILRDAHDANFAKQWTKIMKDRENKDRIFMARDGNLNPIAGTLGDVDEAKQTIRFSNELLGVKELSLDKLQGLQFTRVPGKIEAALCKVVDVDGNQLVASKLTSDGAKFAVTTPFGATVELDAKSVARIDFNFGKLTFLSDLEPKLTTSGFLGSHTYRKDVNLDSQPIMLQDKKYDKGLSIYAGNKLQYTLAGKYKEFKAVVGVDPRIADEGQGHVKTTKVAVYCDGKRVFYQDVTTRTSIPLNINVKDVETLRIEVNGPDFTDLLAGHAILANAHVSQ